jgi:putative toxin-antitoxin system antitoxin component (TIGR02293 family)
MDDTTEESLLRDHLDAVDRDLTDDEVRQLERLRPVYAHAVSFFRTDAAEWFRSRVPALNGRPLDFLDSDEGATLVDDIIGRAEHGIYT